MMYMWNGFTIVGKRSDAAEALLITIEEAEQNLRTTPSENVDTHTYTHTLMAAVGYGRKECKWDTLGLSGMQEAFISLLNRGGLTPQECLQMQIHRESASNTQRISLKHTCKHTQTHTHTHI